MKIAVPVLGTRIAPRLCFTRDFLIVEAVGREAQGQQRVSVGEFPMLSAFVDWITQQGVGAVLCCGANRWAITALESKGVEVIWGLTGEAEERIKAYLDGTLNNKIPIRRIRSDGSSRGGGRRRGQGCGAGGGNRGGRGGGEARGGRSSRDSDGQ